MLEYEGIAPPANLFFEPVTDLYGTRFVMVFGNEERDGFCPSFRARHCLHCNIGEGEGRRFDIEGNRRRLKWYRTHYADILQNVGHLVIYNSGSVLNPAEFSPVLLQEMLIEFVNLPQLRAISLDSREAYVTFQTIGKLIDALPRSVALRPILGIETINHRIREHVLQKKGSQASIVNAFREIGSVGATFGRGRIGLDVNILVGGPGTSKETVVQDAVLTCLFAIECSEETGTSVDFNINPYYPSKRGISNFPEHGRCSLEIIARAVESISALIRRRGHGSSQLFVGWNDEGHDQEPELRKMESMRIRPLIDIFNVEQDPTVFRPLAA